MSRARGSRQPSAPITAGTGEWRRATDWSIAVNVRSQAHDYPVDTTDETTLMWNGVGGSTGIYTATWPRYRPSDFRKGAEHGLAPDWPISYEDLAPYFDMADEACGISGWAGDPAMPPRGPFQTCPGPPGAMGEAVVRGFDALGWHWWPMPCAILAEGYDGRLACNNCGACQSGCPRGSLNDMAVTHWPKALASGVELRTDSRVERIETDASGRATGVVYVERNTGVRHVQSADIVILAANGVGTPRLLLLSESAAHPNGLANRSDQVGRNLIHHTLGMVECWVDGPTESHKGLISAIAICEEFAESDTSRGFVNGFTLHIVRQNGAGYQALGSHSGNVAPWGADHHAWFARHFGHGMGILIVGDDLPRPGNRVTLSDTVVDSSGLPAPRIAYGMCENDARACALRHRPGHRARGRDGCVGRQGQSPSATRTASTRRPHGTCSAPRAWGPIRKPPSSRNGTKPGIAPISTLPTAASWRPAPPSTRRARSRRWPTARPTISPTIS